MSTLATWSHVVQSRDVSPHNFDGLAMSGLAFSVAPLKAVAAFARKKWVKLQNSAKIYDSFHNIQLFSVVLPVVFV